MITRGLCFVFNERSKVAQIGLKSNYVVGFLGKKRWRFACLAFHNNTLFHVDSFCSVLERKKASNVTAPPKNASFLLAPLGFLSSAYKVRFCISIKWLSWVLVRLWWQLGLHLTDWLALTIHIPYSEYHSFCIFRFDMEWNKTTLGCWLTRLHCWYVECRGFCHQLTLRGNHCITISGLL